MATGDEHYTVEDHQELCVATTEDRQELCVATAALVPNLTRVDDRYGPKNSDIHPVAILGAGVGGLYAAMILQSLDIPFKIIEATDRIGGRLRTHNFLDADGHPVDSQYYDVGAMRFPIGLPVMLRLKKLFEHRDIKPEIALIPYKFESEHNMGYLHYNGQRGRKKDFKTPGDYNIFRFSEVGVPKVYLAAGYDRIVKDVRQKYVKALAADMQPPRGRTGWYELMKQDRYSTRAYMASEYVPSKDLLSAPVNLPDKKGLPNGVINWCETMSGSTAAYDGAFTQTVLGAMAFGATDSEDPPDWKCIVGGSSKLTDAMASTLKTTKPIIFNAPVTAIGLKEIEKNINSMTVTSLRTIDGQDTTHTESFSHVISTLPLPVLRTLDLSDSHLTLYQEDALRQLQYKDSAKIGVQFKTAWWTYGKDKSQPPADIGIVGGQSFTDMPIRTVVYPSYGLKCKCETTDPEKCSDTEPPKCRATEPAVLIASYSTTEDAKRFAALILQFNSSKFDPAKPWLSPLASLVLRNLAEVHNVELSFLQEQVMAIHAWDWNNDPYAMGCSSFFGPGDFQYLYPHMCHPAASGRLHFAGDAISARHAWVVGALDSTWRAVQELLKHSVALESKLPEFKERWGANKNSTDYDGQRREDPCHTASA